MEKRMYLPTVDGNVNLYGYYQKQYRGSSKIKNSLGHGSSGRALA
jgi:hypothetical protein